MARFLVRRLALLVPILFGLSLLLFLWVRALPGSPVDSLLGERATPGARERFEKAYGLDRPLWQQYVAYVQRAVQLDLGTSVRSNRPVLTEFWERFPATIELALAALFVAVGLGIPLGYFAARRFGTWLDNLSVMASLIGVTIPVFFLAFLFKYVFAVKLGWLPSTGRQDSRLSADHPTGFYVLDGLVTGNPRAAWDAVEHLILPALALASIPLAIIVRITRASVLDVLNEDYVRTAEAKGLEANVIRRRHVLRNAMLPVSTTIGLQAGLLLSGAILTETVFGIPGIGTYLRTAIDTRDYSAIQGVILIIAVIYVLVNLLVDISYGLIDPRVRVQ
jgi:peptide/nickel transport system permease protein